MTLQNNIARQHNETQKIIVPYKTEIIILKNNITGQKEHCNIQSNNIIL